MFRSRTGISKLGLVPLTRLLSSATTPVISSVQSSVAAPVFLFNRQFKILDLPKQSNLIINSLNPLNDSNSILNPNRNFENQIEINDFIIDHNSDNSTIKDFQKNEGINEISLSSVLVKRRLKMKKHKLKKRRKAQRALRRKLKK
ncbi:mitochondrial 37S ribosomal protein mS38 ASCRUDRAFT_78729 [Ascoidea rubescens DSM 1968]|uniref:Ribosomal protein mS38 C-terminal domain-containing protein n=1 Tax=Ascoidea rubescens DSM 1968 TaxID=1344418 RepID=A0A1D2VQ04_9ASCO|nr:hypothetical protein ASCRUDRAFT_78729 [Ascoidea rubescens DSM 1968]ODV63679.1 hypothetical protein ASCRUDRAFT_78729 [Ascoidea rubescens DSM 1968]